VLTVGDAKNRKADPTLGDLLRRDHGNFKISGEKATSAETERRRRLPDGLNGGMTWGEGATRIMKAQYLQTPLGRGHRKYRTLLLRKYRPEFRRDTLPRMSPAWGIATEKTLGGQARGALGR